MRTHIHNKNVLLLVLLLSVTSLIGVNAQTVPHYDTITGLDPHYHWTNSYTTTSCYQQNLFGGFTIGISHCPAYLIQAYRHYTPRPIAVKGLATLSFTKPEILNLNLSQRLPEYLYLYQYSTACGDTMILIDSLRWDTTQNVKVFRIPKLADTSYGWNYCYLYEVYFKAPHIVDSTFFVGGSGFSNYNYLNEEGLFCRGDTMTRYPWFSINYPWELPNDTLLEKFRIEKVKFINLNHWNCCHTEFLDIHFAITDYLEVKAQANIEGRGTISGTGLYQAGNHATLTAIPAHGNTPFVCWSDSVTANPRTITVWTDTSLTAFFDTILPKNINCLVNNDTMGYIDGCGLHESHDTVSLQAIPYPGAIFDRWDDGSYANPRQLFLTTDTTVVAYFVDDPTGINSVTLSDQLSLQPNPTRGLLTIAMDRSDDYALSIYDTRGLSRHSSSFVGTTTVLDVSTLPAGYYLVKIRSARGVGIKGFVKQ